MTATPVAAQRLEIAGPRARADDRQAEHRAERDADRLAVERIGAARGEHQPIRAERGGVARERPQVVDVGQILGHDQRPRARAAAAPGAGRSPIARQPRWTWKPAMASSTGCAATKTGNGPVERVGQRREPRRRQQHGVHGEPAADQPAHDPLALGDEPAPLGVELAAPSAAGSRPAADRPGSAISIGGRLSRARLMRQPAHARRIRAKRRVIRKASDADPAPRLLVAALLAGLGCRKDAGGAARRARPAVGVWRRSTGSRSRSGAGTPTRRCPATVPGQRLEDRLRLRPAGWTARASRTPSAATPSRRRTRPSPSPGRTWPRR